MRVKNGLQFDQSPASKPSFIVFWELAAHPILAPKHLKPLKYKVFKDFTRWNSRNLRG